MGGIQKGSWKFVLPPGAQVKKGTKILGGQSGGPIPEGAVLTIDSDIRNDGKKPMIFAYEYEWPHQEDSDHSVNSSDNPDST